MESRIISILAPLAIVAAMVAPALAQSSGGSSTPSTSPAPSATQPGSTTSPSTPAPGTGPTGKSKSGMGTTSAPSGSTSSPSAGNTSAPSMGSTSKSDTGMNGGAGGSEQVKAVQKALQDKGMDPGPLDGVMGPKTMAALKAFQKDQKLTESGRLDDQTRDKLGVTR